MTISRRFSTNYQKNLQMAICIAKATYKFKLILLQIQHMEKVWFITGASRGLRSSLAEAILLQGRMVAAAARY